MFKKIFFGMSAALLFAACTEDYTDWAEQQTNGAVAPQTLAWTVTAEQSGSFVLDNITSETVKLFTVSLPENASATAYNVKLTADGANYADYNITADAEGNVSVADLQKAVTEMFTVEAVERTFNAVVSSDVTVKGQTGEVAVNVASDPIVLKVTPLTPEFDQFVYFIGATDGWSTPDQKVESPTRSGVYTGFVYIADPNGWGVEFKFQKRAGDWADDSQLNSNNVAEVTGDFEKTGDNFKASAGEGVYYVELDLAKNTLKGTLVTTMGIIGDFNGWGGDVVMTWNPTDFCYEATDPGVTANGWKFRINADWAINLGGSLTELVNGGDNLSAVGTTIKLYPTRKTSDKIYCTVE